MRDGRIVDITPFAQTLTALYPGAAVIDARDRIVFPGFVNAHFHGESVLLRYLTRRSPYSAWDALPGMRDALRRLKDPASAGDVAALYRLAGYLHITGGTTAVAEYPAGYTPAVLEGAVESLGTSGVRSVFALQTWEQVEPFRSVPPASRGYSLSLGPEDAYTVYSLESLIRISAETGFPLAAHLGEVRSVAESLRRRFKKNPLRVLKDAGALTPSTHIIHCNHLPDRDLDVISESGNPLTLCVRSALSKQTGYPFLRALASRDVTVCLGTDWGETDLLGEIRVLRNLRRYVPGTPSFTPLELMRMATINGAHALGIASQTGSLEVGKHADLVMMPVNDPRLPSLSAAPTAEEVAALITDYCDTGMISDVMAQGVFRVRRKEPVRADRNDMLRESRRLQGTLLPGLSPEREGERPVPIPLVAAVKGERPPLLGDGAVGEEPSRREGANLRSPERMPEESPQKPPVVTRKIGKVFGEDDI